MEFRQRADQRPSEASKEAIARIDNVLPNKTGKRRKRGNLVFAKVL